VFLVLLMIMAVRSYAQSGLTGSWNGKEGQGRNALAVLLQLNLKGNILSGTRTVTFAGGKQECQIENGKVEGRLFSFECELTGSQGDNPFRASFEGFINSKGDEITVSPQKPASGGPVTLTRVASGR
jgi:hypothetical protein